MSDNSAVQHELDDLSAEALDRIWITRETLA
jgi:hypothetical protein